MGHEYDTTLKKRKDKFVFMVADLSNYAQKYCNGLK